MESILDWNTKEGMIFRGGSGSGINLSNIRGSMEPLAKGGTASGPVSFMRGADAWAGTIKSGGKTRRAAKMVVLDVDHPDIRDFIWCKAKEEDKAAALRDAGFDMSIDGEGFYSIQYQNANNSVRVTDEFMQRRRGATATGSLIARTTGEPIGEPIPARELMREIAEAAWRCADPGVQYDTTINQWHTCPNSGRINASNPCSRVHARRRLGLQPRLAEPHEVPPRRRHASTSRPSSTRSTSCFLAQEIVVAPSSYPTEEIGANARAFRQLGLGYANLGAYLMADGMPYDSDEGRGVGRRDHRADDRPRLPRLGARSPRRSGPYDRYDENREPHNARDAHAPRRVLRDPRRGVRATSELLAAARARVGRGGRRSASAHGYRNAQATVLAPTGTISFLMDCDTTGVEPDFSLVKFKELVGGGQMTIVNRTVPLALQTLGYTDEQIEQIEAHIDEHGTIVGAPGLADEHLPVFDVAVGERAISHMGHIKMMGAVQPFISGAISKTVNMPEDGDGRGHRRRLHRRPGASGVKALAIYRDGSKTAQALRTDAQKEQGAGSRRVEQPCRGAGRGRPAAPADAARAPVDHAQVLDRRPRGLHHRRHVRGRHGRRDLPHRHRQGGLDAARDDELVRDRDLDRAPVRRAARDAGAKFSYMRFEPGGDHAATRRSRSRSRCPTTSCAGWPRASWTPTSRRSSGSSPPRSARARWPQDAMLRRRRGDTAGAADGRRHERQRQRRQRRRQRSPRRPALTDTPPVHPGEAASGSGPRPGLRAVRRDDAAHGLVLHVLELRQQHRLRVAA